MSFAFFSNSKATNNDELTYKPIFVEQGIPVEWLRRGIDPKQTILMRQVAEKVELPRYHISQPRIHRTSLATNKELLKLNGDLTWHKALFDKGPGYYYAKCPQEPHDGECVEFVDIVFTLNGEHHTHQEVYEKYHEDGRIEMGVTKAQLFKIIGDKIDTKRKDFHIMPKHIEVIDVYSTLPVTVDLTLKSRINGQHFQSWAQSKGITSISDASKKANEFIHLLVPPKQNGELPESKRTIFVASEEHNSPSFAEYINIDFDSLIKQISLFKTTSPEGMPVYKFITPVAEETNFSLPFWFLLNEWVYIKANTNTAGWGGGEYKLNHLISDSQNSFIYVSQKILNDIIAERKKEHAHHIHLMNLSDVVLEATPYLGKKSWEDYKHIIEKNRKHALDNDDQLYARFQCTVRIGFEKYSGAIPEADALITSELSQLNINRNNPYGANGSTGASQWD